MKSLKQRIVESASTNRYGDALKWSKSNKITINRGKEQWKLYDVWDDVVKHSKRFFDVLDHDGSTTLPLVDGKLGMIKIDNRDGNLYSAFEMFIENLTGVKVFRVNKMGGVYTYYFGLGKDLQK